MQLGGPRTSEPTCEQVARGNVDEGAGRPRGGLSIPCQTAIPFEPGEGALQDPPPRRKALLGRRCGRVDSPRGWVDDVPPLLDCLAGVGVIEALIPTQMLRLRLRVARRRS